MSRCFRVLFALILMMAMGEHSLRAADRDLDPGGGTHFIDIEKLGKIEFGSVWDKNGTSLVTTMKSATPGD